MQDLISIEFQCENRCTCSAGVSSCASCSSSAIIYFAEAFKFGYKPSGVGKIS